MIHLTYGAIYVDHDYTRTWKHLGNQITWPHALLMISNALMHLGKLTGDRCIRDVFQLALMHAFTMKHVTVEQGPCGTVFADNRCIRPEQSWTTYWHSFEQFRDISPEVRLPKHHAWTIELGIISFEKLIHFLNFPSVPLMSPITVNDEDDEDIQPSPTQLFDPLLKILLKDDEESEFQFWTSSIVQPLAICDLFGGRVEVDDIVSQLGISHVFRPCSEANIVSPSNVQEIVPIVVNHNMTLVAYETLKDWETLKVKFGLQENCFDAFGKVDQCPKFYQGLFLTDSANHEQNEHIDAWYVLAAWESTQIAFWEQGQKARCVFEVTGPQQPCDAIAQFWIHCISRETIDNLGMNVSRETIDSGVKISFQSVQTMFPFPPMNFALLLTVRAVAHLMKAFEDPLGHHITIKWASNVLWKGFVDPMTKVQVILTLLQIAFFPVTLGKGIRLISGGKTVFDITIGQINEHSTKQTKLFHIGHEIVGGAGTKDMQKIAARNSLAASLLESGHHIEWVSKTTETIVNHIAHKKLMHIVQLPQGKQRLESVLELCKECQIEIPKSKSDQAKISNIITSKQKRRKEFVINPQNYTIEAGYLVAEDDTPIPQIREIRAQQSGVMLMDEIQSVQWLREGQKITKDEMAIAVIGKLQCDTVLPNASVNLPCKDTNGQLVILACTLVQLGEKEVKLKINTHQPIVPDACKTVAITLWKSDWSESEWNLAIDHTTKFIKQVLDSHGHGDILKSTWGRSLRNGKQTAHSSNATSIQVHAIVRSDQLLGLLQKSGFDRVFITPKTDDGRIDPSWRIIWVEGNMAQLTAQAAKVSDCAGLVKVKERFGLRFHSQHHDPAWQKIYPGKTPPSNVVVNHLYRIEPLPYGVSAEMIDKWASHISWIVKPLKALGPKSWLVGSTVKAPEGLHYFNGNPLILKLIPSKNEVASSPLIAGPRPSNEAAWKHEKKDEWTNPAKDPWASYKPQRDVAGPTEQKFKDHENRMQKMEETIAQLKIDTAESFKEVEKREKKSQSEMHQAIENIKTDINQGFQAAIAEQSNKLDQSLQDLRKLLMQKPKRKGRDENQDEDME